jgi:hypothetical protein
VAFPPGLLRQPHPGSCGIPSTFLIEPATPAQAVPPRAPRALAAGDSVTPLADIPFNAQEDPARGGNFAGPDARMLNGAEHSDNAVFPYAY